MGARRPTAPVSTRRSPGGLALAAACLALALGAPARANIIITPTYDPSLNAAEIAAINSAVAQYQSIFTNTLTVRIYFSAMSSGLGQSEKLVYDIGYQNFRNGLQANYTASGNADQGTALANLPNTVNNPVTNTSALLVSSANARVLGQSTPTLLDQNGNAGSGGAFVYDGLIGLNTSITSPPGSGSGAYSLYAVAQHEINEVLGLGSTVGGTGFFADPEASDLYRFQFNSTTRNYTTAGDNAWFSIDGGTTSLVQFNQGGGGDYGDWHVSGTPRVQDAFGTAGVSPTIQSNGGIEVRALNVIGYTIGSTVSVPEPSTLTTAGLCAGLALGYAGVRRRRAG